MSGRRGHRIRVVHRLGEGKGATDPEFVLNNLTGTAAESFGSGSRHRAGGNSRSAIRRAFDRLFARNQQEGVYHTGPDEAPGCYLNTWDHEPTSITCRLRHGLAELSDRDICRGRCGAEIVE